MPNILSETDMAYCEIESPFCSWPKAAADGSASTATAETSIGLVGLGPLPLDIGAIQIHPSAALVSDPTNNATITVYKRASSNQAQTVLGIGVTAPSGANSTGSWTAWKAVNLTLASGAFVGPGDTITVVISKGGTGVIVPQLFLGLFLKAR